jgi:hypothetical protein
MWYLIKSDFLLFGKRIGHEQSRVFFISADTRKDAERDGGASGNVSEDRSELRTGVAEGSRPHRASNAFLIEYEEGKSQ